MIAWLNPAALWGVMALAGPIAVHLLRRRHAARVPFPSLRFVTPAQLTAVRARSLTDLPLLALRLGIVVSAVVACAQPIVITAARTRAWNERVARAIVVDTSASMPQGGGNPAAEIAQAEARGSASSTRIDAGDVARGLRRAAAWLATEPPARREIVVVSDFQAGALSDADLATVPATIGVRLVRAGSLQDARDFTVQHFAASGVRAGFVRLAGPSSSVWFDAREEDAGGLVLAAPGGSEDTIAALRRAIERSGAPAASGSEPIVVLFGDAQPSTQPEMVRATWMLRAAMRMQDDVELRELGVRGELLQDGPWIVILRSGDGRPLVRAAAAGPQLIVTVPASPADFLGAAAVRAALLARAPGAPREQEIMAIPPSDLQRWTRAAPPVSRDAWQNAGRSDARWLWAVALILLGAEAVVRRRARRERLEHVRAA